MCDGFFNPNFCCPLCHRFHAIRQCSRFIVMDVEQKLRIVAQHSLCYNCLTQSHSRADCKSIDRCRRCMQDHNSWLHPIPTGRVWVKMTAHVRVITRPGRDASWTRAVLDPTTARSSIMLSEAEEMRCVINRGQTVITVLHGHEDGFRQVEVECVVENKTYGKSPDMDLDPKGKYERSDLSANRRWYRSMEYFLILGADVTSKILKGPAKGYPGHIYVQETCFGLAYFGEVDKKL